MRFTVFSFDWGDDENISKNEIYCPWISNERKNEIFDMIYKTNIYETYRVIHREWVDEKKIFYLS